MMSKPQHISIIMDGNGRWAQQRNLPRHAGHKSGADTVKKVVKRCIEHDVKVLTLFAFSSENWKRPMAEVNMLMELFMIVLKLEVKRLNKNNVRLKIIGDCSAFSEKLQKRILKAEELTAENTGLILQIAANYGGQWDITQAIVGLAQQLQKGNIEIEQLTAQRIAEQLSFSDLPDPDLFIRTGGEKRLSNFLLWQAAYSELYFTDTLWPDFDENSLDEAIEDYSNRLRRFGRTSEQVLVKHNDE